MKTKFIKTMYKQKWWLIDLTPFLQLAEATNVSTSPCISWDVIDAELDPVLTPVAIGWSVHGVISIAEAGDKFPFLVRVHLQNCDMIKEALS